MTKDDIIRMAKEADLWMTSDERIAAVERFAALVATHEREACAKIAQSELKNTNILLSDPAQSSAAWNIANSIRARGQE